MKRYFDRQFDDNPVEAISAFARESLKGYVYIEARRQAYAQQVHYRNCSVSFYINT